MKKINPKTQPGLAALKKKAPQVVNKMGYMKKGGEKMLLRMMQMGGDMDMVEEFEMKMRMGGERMRSAYMYGGSTSPKKSMQKYKMGGWTASTRKK